MELEGTGNVERVNKESGGCFVRVTLTLSLVRAVDDRLIPCVVRDIGIDPQVYDYVCLSLTFS